MKKLTGQCFCGAIEYEISGALGPIVNCHCSECRRWHGSAFRSRATVERKAFTWLKGEEHLTKYCSSKQNVYTFCSICGSNLIGYFKNNSEHIGLPLGGLDQDSGHKPVANIFVKYKAPWYDIADNLIQYDEEPPEDSNL